MIWWGVLIRWDDGEIGVSPLRLTIGSSHRGSAGFHPRSVQEHPPVVGGVDIETLFVDGDVVVEPTQPDQVVGVGGAVLGSGGDVVDFDPIPRVASEHRTVPTGPSQNRPPEMWWDLSGVPPVAHRFTGFGVRGDLGDRIAQDCGQRLGSHRGQASSRTPARPQNLQLR